MLLKRLSAAFGPPGQEGEVRDLLRREIGPYVDKIWTDALGNLLAEKKGLEEGAPRVMLTAHMDEVALMITHIEDTGLLRFKTMGGIDQRILVSKPVVVGVKKVPGVIGSKAIHLVTPEERKRAFMLRDLYLDIGASSREEAEKLVTVGEGAVFNSSFCLLGDNRVRAKALDDRVGCSALVEILQRQYPVTLIAAFTVQEEVGLRGARVAAFGKDIDLALVLEATMAFDVPDSKPHETVTYLGGGPALTIMDRTLIADPALLASLRKTARERKIPYQLRRTGTGGTDGGAIHLTEDGIPTVVMAVPCRYLHSPASVIELSDYHHLVDLTSAFLSEPMEGRADK